MERVEPGEWEEPGPRSGCSLLRLYVEAAMLSSTLYKKPSCALPAATIQEEDVEATTSRPTFCQLLPW